MGWLIVYQSRLNNRAEAHGKPIKNRHEYKRVDFLPCFLLNIFITRFALHVFSTPTTYEFSFGLALCLQACMLQKALNDLRNT